LKRVFQLGLVFALVVSLIIPVALLLNKVEAADVVVKEYNFDDGTTQGWGPRGDATVASVKDTARSGANSLKTTGRTANWNGPSLNATALLEKGATYQITGYAKLVKGKAASNLKFTIQRQPEGADTAYDEVNTPIAVTDADWVKLEGEYSYDGNATELQLYAESDDATSEFYLDDISIILTAEAPAEKAEFAEATVKEYNFDDGTVQDWGPRGDATVASVKDAARSGANSLKTTGRTANWNGPSLNATAILEQGATYRITGYAKLVKGKAASNLKFTVQRQPDGADTAYDQVNTPIAVTDADWVKLEGEYSYLGKATELQLYAESDDATSEFYLDDISIVLTAAAPEQSEEKAVSAVAKTLVDANFEDKSLQGWVPRIGEEVLTATDADAHDGKISLLTTGRANSYSAPKLDTTDLITKGNKLNISVWVKLAPGEQPTEMRLSIQRDLNGESSYDSIVGNTLVTADEWVEFKGTYTLPNDSDTTAIYVETAEGTASYYIDDFFMVQNAGKGVQMDIPSLYAQFEGAFDIGAAINGNQTDGQYADLISKHFNIVVAENAMKPGPIQPTEGNFNWTEVDKIVKFAKDNGQLIRFHTLVWHSQAADWMFLDKDGKDMTPTPENKKLLLDRLETHIRKVVERYKDDIRDWDVVNEVIEPSEADGNRHSKWFEITGTEYIERAFKVAREAAGPQAKLYINDYNTHDPKKRDFLFNLVQDLLAKGTPIDGVGHQTHINIVSPSITLMKESIEKFAAIGLDNQITEMDISIYTNDSATYDKVPEEILIEQAHRYKAVFDMFMELKDDISTVILWGTDDSRTWLKTFPITRINLPLVFDEDLQAKYAYWALVDYAKVPAAVEKEVIEKQAAQAYKGTPEIDGEMDAIWANAAEINTNIWVAGKAGSQATVRTMWDDGYLYVYAHVVDSQLSKASVNAYEQDSLEIFVDQNNGQTDSYEADDGQFRVNYTNEQSYNGVASAGNFTTATKVVSDGYIVEAALKLNPDLIKSGAKIGYDIQVNNDEDGDGTRDSVSIWNDPTGFSYQNTVNFGTLELVEGNANGNAKTYTVVAGDNLTKIAKVYGTTWQKLQQLNTFKNPNLIYPGQEIILP
jgi:endo-1,4-beta-xylanase